MADYRDPKLAPAGTAAQVPPDYRDPNAGAAPRRAVDPAAPPVRTSKTRWGWIIAGVVALVVVLMLAFGGGDDAETTVDPAATTAPADTAAPADPAAPEPAPVE